MKRRFPSLVNQRYLPAALVVVALLLTARTSGAAPDGVGSVRPSQIAVEGGGEWSAVWSGSISARTT